MYIAGHLLLEYAIRITFDDLQKNPDLIAMLFFTDERLNQGRDITPPWDALPVIEPTAMDYFTQRLREIPRRPQEVADRSVFRNSIPTISEIQDMLKNANMLIKHGYPKDDKDLPCISITLGAKTEKPYLGDFKETVLGPDGCTPYDMLGSESDTQYDVSIVSTNLDETEVWFVLIDYALVRYRAALEGYGLGALSTSWQDLGPAKLDLEASGLFAYDRLCVVSCTKQDSYPVEQKGFRRATYVGPSGTIEEDFQTKEEFEEFDHPNDPNYLGGG